MRILHQLLLAAFISLVLCGCSNAAEKDKIKPTTLGQGGQQGMKTYYMGRFAIDVPAEFKLAVQSQKIRYAEVSDFKWQSTGNHDHERKGMWDKKIAEISKLKVPRNKHKIIIEEKKLTNIGYSNNTVVYYGNNVIDNYIYWTVLVDYGDVGVWLTLYGADNGMILKNLTNILTHYQFGFNKVTKESFCLNYGKFLLPFLEQEETYARFEGPMGMVLKVEVHEIHKAPVDEGIISRTVAAIATGFAADININKIRSRKRIAAGLPGEEEILQGDDGKHNNISFDWEYLGSIESGEKPKVQITVDTKADNLDEKIRIWDKTLDSFRPVYK